MDISKPMKEDMYVRVPGYGNKLIRQKLRYSGFPDSCFACRQRGHIAANCPNQKDKERGNETKPYQEAGKPAAAKGEGGQGQTQRQEADPKNAPVGKKPVDAKEDFQTVKRKGGEEEEDGEVLPEAENEAEEHDHEGSQSPAGERNVDIGRNVAEGANAVIPAGNKNDIAAQEDQTMAAEREHFTNFEEAERINARPASILDQDNSTRLSCANRNRLVFAEGRKKSRGEEDQPEPAKENCTLTPASPSTNTKKGNKNNTAKPPTKGR
ncbi:hypothetical protein R1sor_006296 [Riccia sorocarpa]|uniref:CCHC-type domain-containing protein n=1 Tax=Riccia sorocarpa TaxID=122646 RepID=A0ABD3HRC4_9MARC